MANTYTKLLFHIVFSTKKRAPLISDMWRDDLFAYIGGIVREIDATRLSIVIRLDRGLTPTATFCHRWGDWKNVFDLWFHQCCDSSECNLVYRRNIRLA